MADVTVICDRLHMHSQDLVEGWVRNILRQLLAQGMCKARHKKLQFVNDILAIFYYIIQKLSQHKWKSYQGIFPHKRLFCEFFFLLILGHGGLRSKGAVT